MGLFRRREPLHVRLARESGVDLEPSAAGGTDETRPPWDASGIHGIHRARTWDTVTTVQAPEQPVERVDFVAIGPDEVSAGANADAAPFTAALDRSLPRPYRGEAVYRGDDRWAVGGRRVEIVRLPGVAGDEIELTSRGAERTLLVDGAEEFGTTPQLERPEHVVRARRIVDDAWEVETHPL